MRAADLLVTRARPWSDGGPIAGADTIAIGDGRILAVGTEAALESYAGPDTRRLSADGATVTPGLCDAHVHLVAWARSRRELKLEGITRRRDALEAVARHCVGHPGNEPIIGRGWASDAWEAQPDHAALDAVAPGRVVLLHSKDFHALWVSGAALARAGVSAATPDPTGGTIERLPSGAPSGVLREHAVRLFRDLAPPISKEADLEGCRAAAEALLKEGVTSVHVFEGDREAEVLRALTGGGGTRVRILMHLPATTLDVPPSGIRSGQGDEWFRWGALKLFADGTLGSRTAAMLEPYDGTTESGMDLLSRDELRDRVRAAFGRGLSVAVHAIGDRAVRATLDAFEAAGPGAPLAPRIEHAQIVAEEDLPRFAALGVAASMQPAHCASDAPLVERWWGTRAGRTYPWRSLLESGAVLAFGSDAPVEAPSVASGLHAAVTRARRGGGTAPAPWQRVSLDEALTAYTAGPARLAGWWPRLGSLREGAEADLVVWNADLRTLPAERLAEARPASTLLAGRVGYSSTGSAWEPARSLPGEPR